MRTDEQLKRDVRFTRSVDPTTGDLRARCEKCGETVISTTGPAALNRSIASHRDTRHRFDTT